MKRLALPVLALFVLIFSGCAMHEKKSGMMEEESGSGMMKEEQKMMDKY